MKSVGSMEFPYGRAPLGILLMTLLAGAGLFAMSASERAAPKADLVLATFTKEHAAAYRATIPAFEKEHHCTVQIQVVDVQALQSRLQSAMQVGADVPDMVELQDGFLSFFIRGPLEDVQLVELTERLKSTGLYDQIVLNRFSKWSDRGHVFALPHDVHPTMLAYRKDLVAQLGIDVNKLTTWDEFCRVGREICSRSRTADGAAEHYMLDLPTDGTDILPMLALQHGGAMFDANGDVAFDSEAFVDAICWYVQQIQGPTRIAFPAGWGQNLAKCMLDGLVLFYPCPDWRTMQFEMDVPSLKGKLALMPLPAWEPGGRRVGTWGATGMAFPKSGRNFSLAWQLATFLYYDPAQLGPRFLQTNILPPLKTAWTRPEFSQINDYWRVSLGQTFVPLAPQVPAAPTNAFHYEAISHLNKAFTAASQYYAARGEPGLRELTHQELSRAAEQVRMVMRRNVFQERERLQQQANELPATTAPAASSGERGQS